MDQQTNDMIKNEIESNEVCLFMKGTPDAPQCGFSMAVTNILKILEVNFKSVDVLANQSVREGIKINPFKDLINKYEYFFGEDQGRYIIEIEKTNIKKVNDLLEKNSVHYDNLGLIEDKILSFNEEINLPIEELSKTHKYWLKKYMEN